MKQKLENLEVDKYSWIDGTEIVADTFTMNSSKTKGLKEIIEENLFINAVTRDNLVKIEYA